MTANQSKWNPERTNTCSAHKSISNNGKHTHRHRRLLYLCSAWQWVDSLPSAIGFYAKCNKSCWKTTSHPTNSLFCLWFHFSYMSIQSIHFVFVHVSAFIFVGMETNGKTLFMLIRRFPTSRIKGQGSDLVLHKGEVIKLSNFVPCKWPVFVWSHCSL